MALPDRLDKHGELVPLPHNHQIPLATFATWTAKIPAQYAVADLLVPAFWAKVELALQARTGRPRPGDFIRAIDEGGAYDAVFSIEAVDRGYQLRFHHGRLPEGGD